MAKKDYKNTWRPASESSEGPKRSAAKKTYAAPAAAKRAGSVNARGGTKGMAKAQTDIARVKALKAEITRLKAMVNKRPSVPAAAKRAGSVNGRGGTKGMTKANKAIAKTRANKYNYGSM